MMPTPSKQIPDTIRTLLAQIGKLTMMRIGRKGPILYKCDQMEGEYRSGTSSFVRPDGLVEHEVGLVLAPNGKRGQHWKFIIAYEPDDTYSVYLWRVANPREQSGGLRGVVLESHDDVYADMLSEVIEHMYDRAIKKFCGGFLPA